jgi:hypothetical protein
MILRYDDDGRILSCSAESLGKPAGRRRNEHLLEVPDDELPKDFLVTFALGGYLVRKGKVVRSRKTASAKGGLPPDTPDGIVRALGELRKKPRRRG